MIRKTRFLSVSPSPVLKSRSNALPWGRIGSLSSNVRHLSTTTFRHCRCGRCRCRHQAVATTTTAAAAATTTSTRHGHRGAAIGHRPAVDVDNDRYDLIGLRGTTTTATTTIATVAASVHQHPAASGSSQRRATATSHRRVDDRRTVGGGRWRGRYAKVVRYDGIVLDGGGRGRGRRGGRC